MLSLLADLGVKLHLQAWTDSSASKGICSRQSLETGRHLDTQDFWVQHRIKNGAFAILKVDSGRSPGDIFIESFRTHLRTETFLQFLGWHYRDGKAKFAPALKVKEEEWKEIGKIWTWSEEEEEEGHGDIQNKMEVIILLR